MASMTRIRPGEPGHGGRSACLRRRPVRIINGVNQGGWTDQWEIVCPACGDDVNLDYVTISPFLQRIRGPYPSESEGQIALRRHRGEPVPAPVPAPKAAAQDGEPTGPGRVPPAVKEPTSVGAAGQESGTGQRF
jgi:hypothetical protein